MLLLSRDVAGKRVFLETNKHFCYYSIVTEYNASYEQIF